MSNKNFIKATTSRRKTGVRKYPPGIIFVDTFSNAVFIQMSSYCVSWYPLGKDVYYKGAHQVINDPNGLLCSKICEEFPPDDAE